MISSTDRLLTRIVSCLRLDKKNPEHLHVEMDAIVAHLDTYGLPVPQQQYEALVKKMLKEQVKNKVELGEPFMMKKIAAAFVELAINLITVAELSFKRNIETTPEEVKERYMKDM